MDCLVSIVVPVYNVEKHLEECVYSIIGQTYKNIEVILVNDGSTDGSLGICNDFAVRDSRIIVIDKKNEGLSVARQVGIDNCRGRYFCTVDSDDKIDPLYVEELLRCITTSESDIALCAVCELLYDGTCKNVELPKDLKEKCNVSRDLLKKKYAYLLGRYQMSDSWNKMYRTAFVRDSGVKFKLSKDYNGTDLLFNHSLLLYEPTIAVVNKPLYYYRIVENSRVRRKDKHLEKGFRVILDYLLEENQKSIASKDIEYQMYVDYLNMLKYATQDFYEEHRHDDKSTICNGFYDICCSMPDLQRKNKWQVLKRTEIGLKVFDALLLSHSIKGMYLYYKFRDLIKKIV